MIHIKPVTAEELSEASCLIQEQPAFSSQDIAVAMEVLEQGVANPEKNEYFWFAAYEESGMMTGLVCFGPIPLTQYCYDLYWILVRTECARRAVGSSLVRFMEEYIAEKNGGWIYVDTSSSSKYHAAREFYKKNGYSVKCVLEDFYKEGDDKVLFRKKINRKCASHSATVQEMQNV